ncbi:MAG TPA: YraN family protein [Puia sp.]|nr:YraN family protein [Puia sp.]
MARHNELGNMGEELAVAYLQEQGYELLERNWRHSHSEIDIIARKEGVLHFIEVKSRSNDHFGFPEEGVDDKKLENLLLASEAYLDAHPGFGEIQFDILSILIPGNGKPDYFLIEDVYL